MEFALCIIYHQWCLKAHKKYNLWKYNIFNQNKLIFTWIHYTYIILISDVNIGNLNLKIFNNLCGQFFSKCIFLLFLRFFCNRKLLLAYFQAGMFYQPVHFLAAHQWNKDRTMLYAWQRDLPVLCSNFLDSLNPFLCFLFLRPLSYNEQHWKRENSQ